VSCRAPSSCRPCLAYREVVLSPSAVVCQPLLISWVGGTGEQC
jgi:hypothetical protein